jgi:hypothetical protein
VPDVVVPIVVRSPWTEFLIAGLRSTYIAATMIGAGMLVQATADGYGIGAHFQHPLLQWFSDGNWYGWLVAFIIGPFWRSTRAFGMAQQAQVVGTPVAKGP